MGISTLYLDVYADFLFDETDHKYTNSNCVFFREQNGKYKVRTLSACESLAISFFYPLVEPLYDEKKIPETIKVKRIIKDFDTGECLYMIPTSYSDVALEQILCEQSGCKWIMYPTKHTILSEKNLL